MFKEGSAVPFFPKIQTLHALRALEGDHLSPHKSVPYSPEKIIQLHLFNIFTLKHDLRTFVSKNVASRIFALVWAKPCLDWGVGRGVKLISAMPVFWEHLVLKPLPASLTQ